MMYYIRPYAILLPIPFFTGYLESFPSYHLFSAMVEKNKITLLILAIALLICLAPMPYGYYMLIRYAATILFGVMTYDYFQNKQKRLYVICLALALLFQPILKIPFGREIWNLIDVVVAVFLLWLFFRKKDTNI